MHWYHPCVDKRVESESSNSLLPSGVMSRRYKLTRDPRRTWGVSGREGGGVLGETVALPSGPEIWIEGAPDCVRPSEHKKPLDLCVTFSMTQCFTRS